MNGNRTYKVCRGSITLTWDDGGKYVNVGGVEIAIPDGYYTSHDYSFIESGATDSFTIFRRLDNDKGAHFYLRNITGPFDTWMWDGLDGRIKEKARFLGGPVRELSVEVSLIRGQTSPLRRRKSQRTSR